jgi:hypothetical protein
VGNGVRTVLFRNIRLLFLSNKFAISRFFFNVKRRAYFSFFKKLIPILYKTRSTRLVKQFYSLSLKNSRFVNKITKEQLRINHLFFKIKIVKKNNA